tara:strand:- start:10 stop:1392 length:1383 start_codon:yes stop_codon:yes gene_type:complete
MQGYKQEHYEFATNGLDPKHSSKDLFKGDHTFNIVLVTLSLLAAFIFGYNGIVLALNIFSFTFFLYRFILTLIGLTGDKDDEKKAEYSEDLPKYSILLPMRNEPVDVVKTLIKNIDNLNYPKDKLDVVMLVDIDDDHLADIRALAKPDHFRILSSEATFPFTKPKVCNLGLATTDAEFVTIYDAEDEPEADQLLKALYKFQDENVACVQCRLHYNNTNPNWLARFFNLEYLTWFSTTIVGLAKSQGRGAVVPLGGTSQHLRVKQLIEIGGWDALNVTEDCDLGIRLSRLGYTTVVSNSYTNEIAVEKIKFFIPQRTRWQMGFMVTYINHCKQFPALIRELGLYRFLHFLMSILGNFLNPLITPLLFFIWVRSTFFGYGGETFLNWLPMVTLIGNYLLIVISHLLASILFQRGKYWYMSLLQPFYYLIQVVTVYRAVYKLFTATYTWEKTPHEVDKVASKK